MIVTVGTTTSEVCAGSPLAIPFTVNAPFGSNNVFTAQLSNSSGSFSSQRASSRFHSGIR